MLFVHERLIDVACLKRFYFGGSFFWGRFFRPGFFRTQGKGFWADLLRLNACFWVTVVPVNYLALDFAMVLPHLDQRTAARSGETARGMGEQVSMLMEPDLATVPTIPQP